jgi:hypothetical protein
MVAGCLEVERSTAAPMGPGLAPLAETTHASSITYRSALLFGKVNPRGLTTRVWFEIGRSRSYGHRVPPYIEEEFGGEEFYEYEEFAECLRPRTTYHYRLVARSPAGTAYGADQTFRTRSRHENPMHKCTMIE